MKWIGTEEMKQLELDILRAFITYCETHELRYFLFAGTLIGAVRHNGFIPWDDDIDVAMPRPDYNRFMELVKTQPVAEHLRIYDCHDPSLSYWAPMTKLVDDRTASDEIYQGKGVHNGVWVDIFPVDGLPADEGERAKLFKRLKRERTLLTLETLPFVFTKNPIKLLKRILVYPIYLFCRNKNHKIRAIRINDLAAQYAYEDHDLVTVTSDGTAHEGRVMQKQVVEHTMPHPFETLTAQIPVEYDTLLRKMYGDYMTPPPAHLQIPIHRCRFWWKED